MNRLSFTSYKWIRVGKGEIHPDAVSTREKRIARELEADYVKYHGFYPDGFILKGGGVGTIPKKGE